MQNKNVKIKKVNPRRRPATQAEVHKAKRNATAFAVRVAFAIIFTVMRDKFGWGKKRLRQLWDYVEDLSESIKLGYVNVNDLLQTLEDEAGISFGGTA